MAAPANIQRVIQQASQRWGVSPIVLSNLLRQESGYREGVTSPAGARDIAQFMPATARSYGVTLGDNRVQDDIFGAAHYLRDNLKRTGGNYAQALSIYNSGSPTGYQRISETRNYVQSILGGVNPGQMRASGASGAAGGAYGVTGSVTAGQIKGGAFSPGNGDSGLSSLLAQLQSSGQPGPVQTMQLQAPASSADRYLRTAQGTGGGITGPGAVAAQPRQDVSSILSAIGQLGGQNLPQSSVGNPQTSVYGTPGGASSPSMSGARGRIIVDAGANRPGVNLTPLLRSYVSHLAGVVGHPITIGTGTNHSRMTVDGNVSDHWNGNAADIPASGTALTRLGQEALIAYGMNPAKARSIKGGLFNLQYGGHRVQVIFNTNEGGNHYTHLHVGVR